MKQHQKSCFILICNLLLILTVLRYPSTKQKLPFADAFSFHNKNYNNGRGTVKVVTNSISKSNYKTKAADSSLMARRNNKINKTNNRLKNDSSPGSELFPAAGSSYIPSGLTEKEWNEIKQKERKDIEKKDFGAWGPRFARSDRPDGDWMVMPSLWTRGFNSNSFGNGVQQQSTARGSTSSSSTTSSTTGKWNIKRLVPIYVMTLVILEWILATFYSFHKKGYMSLFLMAAMKIKKSSMIVVPSTKFLLQGIIAAKLFMSAMLLQPMKSLLVKLQDRFQWKFTSCVFFVTAATVISSLLFSTLAIALFGGGVGGVNVFR
mmetsp:Transcript_339/g.573  ORF Transcript_339/g.573 Transcript_339/m.573 type:complete len:319 (+) Transcript_339:59-1015(+)